MLLKEITDYLESFAPLNLQEDYDNSGLIVGNKNTKIKAALISLDCIEDVVDEALKKNCNLIIAHHPIIFKGLKTLTGNNYIEKTVIKAIKNDIAIYAIHTNLDNVVNGVNFKMAELLGLNNLEFLAPKKEDNAGSGIIGNFKKNISFENLLDLVKVKFNNATIRYTKPHVHSVNKIALCGGSGSFLLENAIQNKADIFITSDFKYHQFFDAENKITILDIGHYEAEILTKPLIGEILSKKFPKFAVCLSDTNTNPIKYY